MENPDITAYGADDISLLARNLLWVTGVRDCPRFEVRTLTKDLVIVVCVDTDWLNTPIEANGDGVIVADFNGDQLRQAVGDTFRSRRRSGAALLCALRLWDRIGYDFKLGHCMIDMVIDASAGLGVQRMEEWGECIEFLLSRSCPVLPANGACPLRARLANLRLIPVLLRPRRPKRLPAVLVRMVKEMLTGFVSG